MTESENIDSTQSTENVTVTSDAAFERVASDIKMEEGGDSGFLKQNTAGLVQEIPNISILDISDFLIENKKTLYDRQNWNVVVGKAGRSIEAQPQDIGIFRDVITDTQNGLGVPSFNEYTPGSNNTCFTSNTMPGVGSVYTIKQGGIYRVSYSFSISDISSSATGISRYIMMRRGGVLTQINMQFYGNIWAGPALGITDYAASGDTHIELQEGDILLFAVKVADTNGGNVTWRFRQAELTLQFIQYKL